MARVKRSRTRLDIQQKLEALKMLNSGTPAAIVMKKFKVSSRFVTKLRKEGEKIQAIIDSEGRSIRTKTIRPVMYPEIDEKVYKFCDIARSTKLPVTQDLIRERALLVRDNLLQKNDLLDSDRNRFEKFSASVGWCQKFVKRHCICSVSLSGEAGSAYAEYFADSMIKIRDRLREFQVENIYNVDETGLFYKLLPRRSYIMAYEKKTTLRGTKQIDVKDRITAYVCTNADGSRKLPMAVIGKAANPRCFRLGTPPVPYFSNKTAWSHTATFRKWFNYIFLPHVRGVTSGRVALIVDNASSHNELRDLRGQV